MTNPQPIRLSTPAFTLPLSLRPQLTPVTTPLSPALRVAQRPSTRKPSPAFLPQCRTPIDSDTSTETPAPPLPPTHDPDTDTSTDARSTPTALSPLGSTPQGKAVRAATAAAVLAFAAAQFTAHFTPATSVPQQLEMPDHSTILSAINDFIIGPHFVVAVGMGLSAFIQALTGFGFAIVSVGGLSQIAWIAHSSVFNVVQPVAATLGAITGWILVLPEIDKVKWKDIGVLLVASTLATPLGPLVLEQFDPILVLRTIGALITAFVVYSVTGVSVPKRLGRGGGAWFLGALSGALGGAFDMTGPPLVVHAQAADWQVDNGEFRRNVLTVISFNSTLVVLYDFLVGRLNDYYYWDFLEYAMPTTILGVLFGKYLAKRLDATSFKRIVLVTCLVLGGKLLFS